MILALVVLVTAVFYTGLYGIRLACGLTLQEEPPTYTVRLQLINATGRDTIDKQTLKRLTYNSGKGLDIKIVEETRFALREVSESLVLSRIPDLTAARLLARELGLDPDNVTYRPLEDNRRLASVSLIIGRDYKRIEQIEKPG